MSSADTRLRCYERGDLDEFFGLFGNSLANTLAAIFLISMVAKVPNEIVFGSIVLGAITAFIIDKNYRISTALARPAREPDAHGALLVLQELVSLGPGLTPAGDDFMIGWLAGSHLPPGRPLGARSWRQCVPTSEPGTTEYAAGAGLTAACPAPMLRAQTVSRRPMQRGRTRHDGSATRPSWSEIVNNFKGFPLPQPCASLCAVV
jgi:hypothetical protein